jgi:hypothetical protein
MVRDMVGKVGRVTGTIGPGKTGEVVISIRGGTENLAAPHAAVVQKQARIAQAQADREATEQEQQAEALKAAARRETDAAGSPAPTSPSFPNGRERVPDGVAMGPAPAPNREG